MKKITILVAVLLSAFIVCVAGVSSISGKWHGVVYGPDGKVDLKYNFNQNDTKLTGTVEVHKEILKIDSGRINGPILKFNITDEQGVTIPHVGRLSGDSMNVKLNYAGMEYDLTLSRVMSASNN